jgi:hypothetical protein
MVTGSMNGCIFEWLGYLQQRSKLVLYFTVKVLHSVFNGRPKIVAGAVAMIAELGIDELCHRSDEVRAGWRKKS